MTVSSDVLWDVERQALDAFLAASAASVESAAEHRSDAKHWQELCDRAFELQTRYFAELDSRTHCA